MKKAVIIYCTFTGNTEKVAQSIQNGLELGGFDTSVRKIQEAEDICFYDYDLVCIGAPSYNWRPPKPMDVRSSYGNTRSCTGRENNGSIL